MKIDRMMLFANGYIAAFDEQGEQVPAAQMNTAIELWAEYMSAAGFDVDGCEYTTQRPGGEGVCGVIQKGWDGHVCVPVDTKSEQNGTK